MLAIKKPHTAIPINLRVTHELRSVRRLEAAWQRGVEELERGLTEVSDGGRGEYVRILALGEFIRRTLRTLLNTKLWWTLRMRLKKSPSGKGAGKILVEMRTVAKDEIKNAEGTVKVLTKDSRLGWEPTMWYLTDRARLVWKTKLLRLVLTRDLAKSR